MSKQEKTTVQPVDAVQEALNNEVSGLNKELPSIAKQGKSSLDEFLEQFETEKLDFNDFVFAELKEKGDFFIGVFVREWKTEKKGGTDVVEGLEFTSVNGERYILPNHFDLVKFFIEGELPVNGNITAKDLKTELFLLKITDKIDFKKDRTLSKYSITILRPKNKA